MPKLSAAQRREQEQEQVMNSIIAQSIQQQRTIWQMAKLAGGEVVINKEGTPPLWNLEFEEVKADPNLVRIKATLLPEPTTEQLATLATKLLGTRQHPADLMKEVGLPDHPFSYVSKLLSPTIVLHEGTWISRADYDKIPKEPPKSAT